MQEIEQMFDYLSDLGVDGHTITPGYEYDAAKKDMIKRLNLRPENFFLTRAMTVEKFQRVEKWMSRYTFLGTPIYFEFLAGQAGSDVFRMGDSDTEYPRLERAMLFDDRRTLRELRGVTGKDRMGTAMASSTESRETADARTAWCIAVTSRLRRWGCKHNEETRGKRSSSISARNRNLLAVAARFSLSMA